MGLCHFGPCYVGRDFQQCLILLLDYFHRILNTVTQLLESQHNFTRTSQPLMPGWEKGPRGLCHEGRAHRRLGRTFLFTGGGFHRWSRPRLALNRIELRYAESQYVRQSAWKGAILPDAILPYCHTAILPYCQGSRLPVCQCAGGQGAGPAPLHSSRAPQYRGQNRGPCNIGARL